MVLLSTLLLLIGCGVGLYQNQEKLYRQRKAVQQLREVIFCLQGVLLDLKDAEGWQRGYLITGKTQYLEPYKNACQKVIPDIDNLAKIMVRNSLQAERAARLKMLAKARLLELDDTIECYRKGGFPLAAELVEKRTWHGAMDKIRIVIAELRSTEERVLETQVRKLEQEAAQCLYLIELFSVMIVSLGVVSSVTVILLWSWREQAEQKFRTVFDQTVEFIGVLSPEGILLDANKTALNAIGKQWKDVVGQPFWLTPWWTHSPKEQELLKQAIAEAAKGNLARFEATHIANEGPITVDFSLNPVRDQSGKVIMLVPEGHDITDRKKLETIQIVSYKLGQMLSAPSNPLEGSIIREIIQLACQSTHWEYGALWQIKETVQTLYCSASWAEPNYDLNEFENLSKSMSLFPGQGLPGQVYANGEPLWFSDVTTVSNFPRAPVASKSGLHAAVAVPIQVSGKIVAVLEFFSFQKLLPQANTIELFKSIGNQIGLYLERKDVERQSCDLQEQMLSILTNMNDGVFQLDSSGKVVYMNPAAAVLIGSNITEGIGKDIHELIKHEYIHDTEKPCALMNAISAGQSWKSESDFLIRIDQSFLAIEYSLAPVIKYGAGSGAVLTFRDITKRKEAERRVSEFYSIVSHELRTPLTSIRGAFGLLEGGKAGELSQKAQQLVKVGRIESERLVRLINDILDIRKIEAGQLELKIEKIDPTELVAKTIRSLSPLAAESHVKLDSHIIDTVPIMGDKDRLIQVLTNLISNAIKYSPAESAITVDLKSSEQFMRFSVKDSGPGIRTSDLDKLFRMFQQVDSSDTRQKGGTGLGLATSKAIVEQHDGQIGVDTELGKGSTFWFEIPLANKEQVAKKQDAEPIVQQRTSGTVKVLIVEDDKATQEIMLQQLSVLHADFFLVSDGNEAIEKVRIEKPDLIILDLGLPTIDGFAVVNALKNEKNKTSLLVYTARDLTNEEKSNLQLGPSEHLTKSRTSEQEFLHKVHTLLNRPANKAGNLSSLKSDGQRREVLE